MTGRASMRWRFRDDIVRRVHEEAEARGLTDTWFANKLMEEGLDRLIPADEFRMTRPRPRPLVERPQA